MHEHLDVLIIGAGLSGISAAYHVQTLCPALSYAVLEGRDAMGGTWDLFRYPGVRSDSDMYTLGYRFQPWKADNAIADGASIKAYIEATAREHGIDRKIRFGQRVTRAAWSSRDARWTITIDGGRTLTCGFLYTCTGYYDYTRGYTPDFAGRERFAGTIVHPQEWPAELDWSGKRVVVIGSGATAVTLVPALVERAAHVTMLQRSPTYIASMPSSDNIARFFRRLLPERAAYAATRWQRILTGMFFYQLARRRPDVMKGMLRKDQAKRLGPDVPLDPHFKPSYDPWDERLCLAPDGDIFDVLRDGRASIVTDTITTFTETGLELGSGKHLEADLVVTATGLDAKILAGLVLEVDGRTVELAKTLFYKGMMLSDVPNYAAAAGYTNASWTLKCDLTAEHVCRVLNHMRAHGHRRVTPRPRDPSMPTVPLIDLMSGYVRRAMATTPRQGSRAPWRLYQNYVRDLLLLRYGRVAEDELEFR